MEKRLSTLIKLILVFLILFSFSVVYYSKIVLKDYEIIANEDGPDLEE